MSRSSGQTLLTFGFRLMPMDEDVDCATGTRTIVRVESRHPAGDPVDGRVPGAARALGAGMIGWWAIAAAQDVSVPEPPPPQPYEITVWGDSAVDKARDTIVHEIEALGYRVVRRRDGETVFRPRERWKGRITFLDDGTFTWGRPVVGFTPMPPAVYTDDPRYQSLDPDDPMITGAGPTVWILPSRARLETARVEVLDETRDEVDAYLAIKRRTVFEQSLLNLPDRLDALWTTGAPLEPGPPLATPEARRRAVLEFWATRADTPEGDRTSEAVEDWLGAVVETGPAPITPEERAEFSARRPDRQLP